MDSAKSMPPQNTTGTRRARQVSPIGWMRIFVSRPRTVVTCGVPERTSRHTGALFRGCDAWRCASAAGEEFSGVGAGVGVWVWAYDALASANQNAATTSEATRTIGEST